MKMISELNDHEHVNGQFLLSNAAKCVNATGATYFNVELRDASGTINAKKWDATLADEEIFVAGNVINVIGETLLYRDALQIKILSAELVPLEDIDIEKFVQAPPIKKEDLINKFNYYVGSIKNEDCKKIINYMLNKYQDKAFTYPAATSIHHEYSCGLLMHSTTMADIASNLCPIYGADYDLVITGCLLHDFGKVIELEGPIVFKYSVEGKLLGHISIMAAEIRKAASELNIDSEVPMLLEHMVLAHHGQYDFGSPVLPLTKEALLLSLIDNLDSKMVVVNKALMEVQPGSFSNKVFPLDNRSFYKPKK